MNIPEEELAAIAENLGKDVYQYEGKTVLILGGSGFLGFLVKRFLIFLNQNYLTSKVKIISVDNFIVGNRSDYIRDENVYDIEHDLCFPLDSRLKINTKIDFCYNCAGLSNPDQYSKKPKETLRISTIGVEEACKLAQKHDAKLINFSSSEIYGNPPPDQIPTKESYWGMINSMSSRGVYDVGKKALETFSFIYQQEGVQITVLRPFNLTGFFPKHDTRVFPNMIKKSLTNQDITVYSPGTQTRSFCWFSDACTFILLASLKGKSPVYNIGRQEEEISMINLAQKVGEITGKPHLIKLVDAPKVFHEEPQRRLGDISLATSELGFKPKVTLDQSIEKFYNWAKIAYK